MKYLDQESVTQIAENKDSKKEDETKNKGRGADAKTRKSRDGTWTKKNDKLYFGYKLHILVDGKYSAILNYSVTTASDHYSNTDLSILQIVYRDKGYYGIEPRGIDGTMDKKVKGEDKLPIASIRRNLRISKKRWIVEKPYAMIKSVFQGGHMLVTTVIRVRVKAMFMCLAHNISIVLSLQKWSLIA
ncbi:MAG: transposase [Candidatus Aenigmatarchaeota archaeon]